MKEQELFFTCCVEPPKNDDGGIFLSTNPTHEALMLIHVTLAYLWCQVGCRYASVQMHAAIQQGEEFSRPTYCHPVSEQ